MLIKLAGHMPCAIAVVQAAVVEGRNVRSFMKRGEGGREVEGGREWGTRRE